MIVDEIVSIEEVGVKETIDLTTDGNHLFYANDILTHNSGYDLAENTDMEQVSESMGICHTSDMIMALFQGEGDREAGRLKVKVIKNRYGIIGSIFPMAIDYNSLKISNWVPENNEDIRQLETDLIDELSE